MIILSEIRVKLDILKEVMHPAHIPLERKSKSVLLGRLGNSRPRRRLLSYNHGSRISVSHYAVEVLKKFHCLKITVTAILIRNPVARCLTIIKIQHGCNRINSESVYMEFLNPEKCIGDKEVGYLISAIIKYLCSPLGMLTFSRIGVLILTAAVKFRKSMRILRKMRRYPVKNNSYSILMKLIHKVHKVLRRSISRCRSIIACYLISP